MKALYAYTAKAYANAGFGITNTQLNTWQAVGATPFLQYQAASNGMTLAGNEILFNFAQMYLTARGWDVLNNLTSDEVLTFGCKLRPQSVWGGRYSVDLMGLWNSAGTTLVCPITHLDVVDNTGPDNVSYVEIAVDINAGTVTGYINGKRIRVMTMSASFIAQMKADAYLGMLRPNNNGQWAYISNFYAAICKKSEGPVVMGAWTCEDVEELTSELRDADGNLTRNTVNDTLKTVTFKLPAPGVSVAIDVKAANPQKMSKLISVISDGKTPITTENSKIESRYELTGYGTKTNAGRTIASITPASDATSLSLKLRAQYMQE